MEKNTQKELVDVLLTVAQILEGENTQAALKSDSELATAKGVIARLVIIASNSGKEEKTERGE